MTRAPLRGRADMRTGKKMLVPLPYAHYSVTLVQQIEFAQPLCTYVAYPNGLGGVPRGRLCKSPLAFLL